MFTSNNQFLGYGLQGYILTKKGAQILLNNITTLEVPIDLQMRSLCNTNIIKASCYHRYFCENNSQKVSSISKCVELSKNPNDKQNMDSLSIRIFKNILSKNIPIQNFL